MAGERRDAVVAATPDAGHSFWRDVSATHAANALVGFLFAASGPLAIILAMGVKGGLSEADLASWVFGALAFNGVTSIVFSLAWRQPLAFFWTIPGTVLIGPALGHLTFPEVIGAYVVTGVLLLVLGLLGWVGRVMAIMPMPIVMGMVAGVFLQFGLDWIFALRDGIWIAAPMTAAFLLVSAAPAVARRFPPLIAALLAGAAAVYAVAPIALPADAARMFAAPSLHAPVFSLPALAELVVPLAVTVLLVQNAQGIAILAAAQHAAPANAIAVGCGIASIAAAFVGAVSTCLTGPVNAIISAAGDRRTQYTAGVLVGVLAVACAAFAPLLTRVMLSTPPVFIATLAGLAMLRVLQSAFGVAFQRRFTLGALVTFLVTVAGVPIFNIGAPFWALLAGMAVSLLLERDDWRE